MSQVSEDPFKLMHAFLPGNCICFAFVMFILKTVHTEIYKCYFFDIFQLNSSTYHEHKVTDSFISYPITLLLLDPVESNKYSPLSQAVNFLYGLL